MSLYTWSLTVGEENNNESDDEKTVKSLSFNITFDLAEIIKSIEETKTAQHFAQVFAPPLLTVLEFLRIRLHI